MKKKKFTTIVLIITFLAGLCLVLYPKLSDYWNSFHQTRAITQYVSKVEEIDEKTYKKILKEAGNYNKALSQRGVGNYNFSASQAEEYFRLLNISGNGMMGYVEIPIIRVSLPIFHGSSEKVLQSAVGHLEWTSLPVGGESTHCVLTGHRGLPSSKLFTDLDKLVEGDIFIIRVLKETLTYEVDQILIVDPNDTAALEITSGEDYCTLMTCTPYAINTHRLLVRGHRIESMLEGADDHITADAVPVEPMVVALTLFVFILLIVISVAIIPREVIDGKKQKDKKHNET